MGRSSRWSRGAGLLAALALLTHCARPQPGEPSEPAPAPEVPVPEAPGGVHAGTPPDAGGGSPPTQPEARDGGAAPQPERDAGTPASPLGTRTFGATADATTERTAADGAPGAEPTLRVRRTADPIDRSTPAAAYLRFEPSGLRGLVTRAVLRLYALEGSADGATLHLTVPGWREDTVATALGYRGAPRLARLGAVAAGTWVELDVSSVVNGDGVLDLYLEPDFDSGTTTGKGLVFASREHARAELRPQLVVTEDPALARPVGEQSGCGETWRTELLRPTDDASYVPGEPGTLQGQEAGLSLGGTPARTALLRFAVPGYEASSVRAARLRVFAPEGGPAAPFLSFPELYSWEETLGPWSHWYPQQLRLEPGPVPRGSWVEYDVTPWVGPQSSVGFALGAGAGGGALQLSSREAEQAQLRPQLLIARGEPCASRGEGGTLAWSRQYRSEESGGLMDLVSLPDGGFLTLGMAFVDPDSAATVWPWVVTRYAPEGTLVWRRTYADVSGAGALGFWAIAAAPDGSFALTGTYQGAPDLGAGPLPFVERQSLLVARFAADGQLLWSRGLDGGAGYLTGTDVAVDAQGNVAVTGSLVGTVDFGGGPLRGGVMDGGSANSSVGFFLLVLDAQGAYRGSSALPNAPQGSYPESAYVHALTFDSQGNVLLAGQVGQGSVLGGTGTQTPFVARLAPSGALQWYRRFDGVQGRMTGVASGPAGAVYFGGVFSGRYRFAGAEHDSQAGYDFLLGALGPDGAELWARDLPNAGHGSVERLVVDDAGHLVVLASVASGDLGGGRMGPGLVVARYGAQDGAHRWSQLLQRGTPYDTGAFQLAAQPGGRTLLGRMLPASGYTPYTLPLNGTPFVSRGTTDLLFLQLAP